MSTEHSGSHAAFVLASSERTRRFLLEQPFSASLREKFQQLARHSLDEQKRLEAAEITPFEQFRRSYLAPERLSL